MLEQFYNVQAIFWNRIFTFYSVGGPNEATQSALPCDSHLPKFKLKHPVSKWSQVFLRSDNKSNFDQ